MTDQIDTFRANLYDQKQQRLFTDVILVAAMDGTKIPAHRVILSASSLFFQNLFTIDMKEKNLNEIPLGDVSGPILGDLIDFCYTHQILVDMSNVENYLAAANMFQIVDLVKICENTFSKALDVTNAFKIIAVADHYNLNSLRQAALIFTLEHFSIIVGNEAFYRLDVKRVAEYLGNDDIMVESEEDVFDAVIKWIEHDTEERLAHFGYLLKSVRFSKINTAFVNGRIFDVCKKFALMDVYERACREKQMQEKTLTDVERKSYVKYMYAIANLSKTNYQILRYSLTSNTWETVLNIDRLIGVDSSLNCIDNCVYLVEQEPCGKYRYKSMACLSLATMQIKKWKSPIYNIYDFATAAMGQYLYIIGGALEDCSDPIAQVHRYDTTNKKWEVTRDLNDCRFRSAATVLAGKLYVVGGMGSIDTSLKSVERYDPGTNQWIKIGDLNVSRAYHRCCCIKDKIFAVGGTTARSRSEDENLCSIEMYDEQIDKWTIITATFNIPRYDFGIGTLSNWIYIAGGKGGRLALDDVQRVNVIDGTIENLTPFGEKTKFVDAVMIR